MEKTVFVVCIKEGERNDFLYVCETMEKAIETKGVYERAFPENGNTSLVVYEEVLHS